MFRQMTPKAILFHISLVLVVTVMFTSYSSGQRDIDITAPVDLVLNCNNLDYVIISSWLQDYTATSMCDGAIEVSNDFDGELPDLCGQPKFVKWIIRDECGDIDSSGSTISLANTLFDVGFSYCPPSITVFADTTRCGSQVIFPHPYARDCFSQIEVNQVRNNQDQILQSGDVFPEGPTNIVFEAVDKCGNNDFCRFQVVVRASEDLVNVYCPENRQIRICADQDSCVWVSTDEFLRPGTALNECSSATLDYTITTAAGVRSSSRVLMDEDGNASGFVFPLGQSEVCYEISNGGGNAECCFMIAVEDCAAPTIICPGSAEISCDLIAQGDALDEWLDQAIVSDNCDSNPTVRTVVLDTIGICAGTQMIEYLVIAEDGSSNESACVATLNVSDDEGPELLVTRLPDSTFQCRGVNQNQEIFVEWLSNNAGFNDTHVKNNCPSEINWKFEPSTTTFQVFNNACSPNIGFYDVEFYAEDRCGNRSETTAKARLLIEDNLPPLLQVPDDIVLPCDIDNLQGIIDEVLSRITLIDSCSGTQVNASLTLPFNECPLGESVVDVTFTASDNCGNSINTITQITLVKNVTSLVIAPPPIVLRCGQNIDSIIPEWLEKYSVRPQCDSFTVVNTYEPTMTNICGSEQQVIWLLQDTCGTSVTANSTLTVVDELTPPVFLNCPIDVTIFLDDTDCSGEFTFDTPRAEDCTDERVEIKQILPSIGEEILTSGSDFPVGETLLQFTATDQCNNVSRCEFTITVVDDASCSSTGLSISGNVLDASGNNLEGAVLLIDTNGGEFPKLQVSDARGDYSFRFLPPRQNFSIDLSIEDSFVNGISGLDLLLIRNHILGLNTFTTPLNVIAADANNDQSLSALDIVVLQRLLIGIVDTLPGGIAWKFVETSEIENSTLVPYPRINRFIYTDLRESLMQDFIGVKTGDVNASASAPELGSELMTETRESVSLRANDRLVLTGKKYIVEFTVDKDLDIEGFQLSLDVADVHIAHIDSDLFNISEHDYHLSDDELKLVGLNRINSSKGGFVRLHLEPLSTGMLSDLIRPSADSYPSEIYSPDGDHFLIKHLAIIFDREESTGLQVYQNHPNPYSEETSISFELSSDEEVEIEVFNYSGRVLYQVIDQYSAGKHSVSISANDLDMTGLLYYRVSTAEDESVMRMVLLK